MTAGFGLAGCIDGGYTGRDGRGDLIASREQHLNLRRAVVGMLGGLGCGQGGGRRPDLLDLSRDRDICDWCIRGRRLCGWRIRSWAIAGLRWLPWLRWPLWLVVRRRCLSGL